jgi:hypothetical protein
MTPANGRPTRLRPSTADLVGDRDAASQQADRCAGQTAPGTSNRANDLTPERLADRAAEIAQGSAGSRTRPSVARDRGNGHGRLCRRVAGEPQRAPADRPPLRAGRRARRPVLGLVGKAITFDTGGSP